MKFLCTLDTLVQVNEINAIGVKETVINLRAEQNETYESGYDLTKYAPTCFINLDARGGSLPPHLPVEPAPPIDKLVMGATIVGKETRPVLQQQAKAKGITGGGRMNKAELRSAMARKEQQEIARMTEQEPHEAQE